MREEKLVGSHNISFTLQTVEPDGGGGGGEEVREDPYLSHLTPGREEKDPEKHVMTVVWRIPRTVLLCCQPSLPHS